ncbi:hypothetical protein [Bacillus sp. Au-Bac7]|uniref:hypothetical protein n=1 Tax=Bacillus sp. Au-Bac7 TaxID=2906458 RepID=UPI001E5FCD9A|nr:hypothetical protein [Bacillus sp. Au-Bac7]MCE4049917.1 hypothetical protein [Bacillus sp. Au-Bac7]
MLGTYHKITIDGETFFREYNSGLDSYEDLLTEEELMETVMSEIVAEELDIDHHQIECAVRRVTSHSDREILKYYIRYLERLINE